MKWKRKPKNNGTNLRRKKDFCFGLNVLMMNGDGGKKPNGWKNIFLLFLGTDQK